MASEIRVNKINSQTGVGTITLSPTGVDISGITTVSTLKVGTGVTASEDGDIFFTGVCTATTFAGAHSGSGANLTSLPAAQLTGTLPAISGVNLTNLTATNLTGTIADARFPATLPAASAANLTSIPAANITGTLPALTAANLTNIPAANLVGVCTSGLTKTGGFGGITQADQWRLTANLDTNQSFLTANWERNDTTFAYVGDGMTESSGVFTFPETGVYHVIAFARGNGTGNTVYYAGIEIHTTTDNSSYSNVADSYDANGFTNGYMAVNAQTFFDVTNTSTHKVKFQVAAANTFRFSGSSTKNETGVTFIRLGDT